MASAILYLDQNYFAQAGSLQIRKIKSHLGAVLY